MAFNIDRQSHDCHLPSHQQDYRASIYGWTDGWVETEAGIRDCFAQPKNGGVCRSTIFFNVGLPI